MPERRPVVVLGAERSGTSVVAEMVRRWGAYAGAAEKLKQPDEHNPQGYWEYMPIWDFLVALGDFAEGVSWWDASFQDRVRRKLSIPRYSGKRGHSTFWVWVACRCVQGSGALSVVEARREQKVECPLFPDG